MVAMAQQSRPPGCRVKVIRSRSPRRQSARQFPDFGNQQGYELQTKSSQQQGAMNVLSGPASATELEGRDMRSGLHGAKAPSASGVTLTNVGSANVEAQLRSAGRSRNVCQT